MGYKVLGTPYYLGPSSVGGIGTSDGGQDPLNNVKPARSSGSRTEQNDRGNHKQFHRQLLHLGVEPWSFGAQELW